jgi:DNA-binding response OmpR family regulator
MKKLLIIEDNWMMAHMIEDVATILNIDVIGIATSWDEAKEILTVQKPDFAIVDININGLVDGIEAARRLRAQEIDFLFLTAYKDLETIKEAAELSPLAYMIKPITPENLMATFLLATKKIDQKALTNSPPAYTVENNDLLYMGKAMTSLSKSERRVLKLLIKNIGYTIGYETFLYSTEGNAETNSEASLRNIVVKLRKKCPDLVINNVKDVGYIAHLVEATATKS